MTVQIKTFFRVEGILRKIVTNLAVAANVFQNGREACHMRSHSSRHDVVDTSIGMLDKKYLSPNDSKGRLSHY